MKIEEIRKKKPAEMRKDLSQLKRELMNLRFRKSSGQLESTSRISQVRKTIARLKTVLIEQTKKLKEGSKNAT